MHSREEIKALTERALSMASAAKSEGTELRFDGGEQSGTRWANSTITTNLVQFDQQLSITVPTGTEIRQRDDARVRRRVAEVGD